MDRDRDRSENRQRQFLQIFERRLSDKADKLFYKGNLFDHVFLPRIQLKGKQQVSLEYIITKDNSRSSIQWTYT